MKKLLLITLILVGISEIQAVAQDTIYYNASWQITIAEKASYFRKRLKIDNGWKVTDCFMSGKPQMEGSYADDSSTISQGEFIWYDDKGNLYHRTIYAEGKTEGKETLYYVTGGERETGMNKAGKRVGDWVGYYPSGKLSAKAHYEDGVQSSGSFFNEDGTSNKITAIFSKEATYPRGMPAYMRFLNKTLRYPDTAIKRDIQGTVLLGFNISKNGKISDIKILESVEKSLDEEALRVARLMPDWESLIIGGIPCDSYHKQPIIFKLEN